MPSAKTSTIGSFSAENARATPFQPSAPIVAPYTTPADSRSRAMRSHGTSAAPTAKSPCPRNKRSASRSIDDSLEKLQRLHETVEDVAFGLAEQLLWQVRRADERAQHPAHLRGDGAVDDEPRQEDPRQPRRRRGLRAERGVLVRRQRFGEPLAHEVHPDEAADREQRRVQELHERMALRARREERGDGREA